MANLFTEVQCLNGNINILFEENGKTRRIIFAKGSDARLEYCNQYNLVACKATADEMSADELYKTIIKNMRAKYVFKQNPNNVSVFTPKPKNS